MNKCKITTITGQDIVFRLLSAEESDRLYTTLSLSDNPYTEEQVFNYITEEKYCIDGEIQLDAGVIPTVVFAAIKASGFLKDKFTIIDMLETQRESLSKNAYFQIFSMIASVFPARYTLEELKLKSLNELIELLAFCEISIGKPIIDTKKQRELLNQEEKTATSGKKLINSLSKEEVRAIMGAIQRDEETL